MSETVNGENSRPVSASEGASNVPLGKDHNKLESSAHCVSNSDEENAKGKDNDKDDQHSDKKIKIENSSVDTDSGDNDRDKDNLKNNNDATTNSAEVSVSASMTPNNNENTPHNNNNNDDTTPKKVRQDVGKGKKVPLHLLEKRRIGRIKAAEEFQKRLKQIGIEKIESTTLPPTGGFKPILLINQKNYSSDYIRKDDQIFALRERRSLRSNTNTNPTTTTTTTTTNNNATAQPSPDLSDTTTAEEENVSNVITSEYTLKNDNIDFNDATTTLIIQPGSESIKIGFALDDNPMIIPNCVAVPKNNNNNNTKNTDANILNINQPEEFNDLKIELQQTFKQRMRYYKRRIQPNAYDQVTTFNSTVKGEPIPDQNDSTRIPWINPPNEGRNDNIYIGDEALFCLEENFIHRKPFSTVDGHSIFNVGDSNYSSIYELYGDVIRIIQFALDKLIIGKNKQTKNNSIINENNNDKEDTTENNNNSNGYSDGSTIFDQKTLFKVILVIPDMFEKTHVETMIRLLLTELPFNAVAIMQESLATCYGAGISTSTCVVNIGASATRIACVDEGTVLENSLVSLDYGGNDITKLFAILLLMNKFPYENWNIESVAGWKTAESLKKQCITYQDADITTQLFNFIKRLPGKETEKIEFKTFDEVILAPLALFYPEIFKFLRQNKINHPENKILEEQLPSSRDLFTNELNGWDSLTQEECLEKKLYSDIQDENILMEKVLTVEDKLEDFQNRDVNDIDRKLNLAPLDKAIIQSITNASLTMDPNKLNSFYSNILIVGGSSRIPGFDVMLTDRINIWRPRLLSLNSFPNFYKELLNKIKDLRNNHKNTLSVLANNTNTGTSTPALSNDVNKTDETSRDETKDLENKLEEAIKEENVKLNEEISELIKNELEIYLNEIEGQNSSDHYIPVSVVPAPHDIDPAVVLWKGASVLAQIKLIEELFITDTDWDMHGSRILQHKCIFTY